MTEMYRDGGPHGASQGFWPQAEGYQLKEEEEVDNDKDNDDDDNEDGASQGFWLQAEGYQLTCYTALYYSLLQAPPLLLPNAVTFGLRYAEKKELSEKCTQCICNSALDN